MILTLLAILCVFAGVAVVLPAPSVPSPVAAPEGVPGELDPEDRVRSPVRIPVEAGRADATSPGNEGRATR